MARKAHRQTGRAGRQAARATDYSSSSSLTLATLTYSSLVTIAHNSPRTLIIMAPDVVLVHRLCCDDVPPASFPPPSILSFNLPLYCRFLTAIHLLLAPIYQTHYHYHHHHHYYNNTNNSSSNNKTTTQSDTTNLHAGVCMHVQRSEGIV